MILSLGRGPEEPGQWPELWTTVKLTLRSVLTSIR